MRLAMFASEFLPKGLLSAALSLQLISPTHQPTLEIHTIYSPEWHYPLEFAWLFRENIGQPGWN